MDAVGVLLTERPDLVLIEVGPGETLASLVRQHPMTTPETAVVSTLSRSAEADDVITARRALATVWAAGVDVDLTTANGGPGRRVPLPTYPFARERYWVESTATPALIVTSDAAVAASAVGAAPTDQAPAASPLPGSAVPAEPATSRKERIGQELATILADLSGMDAEGIDRTATFMDLGFDSLFLTQANARFRTRYGIRFTLGQLLGETPTIEALADRIDAELAPEVEQPAATSAPVATLAASTASNGTHAVAPIQMLSTRDPMDGRPTAEQVEWLISEQLRVMEAQLDLLRTQLVDADGSTNGSPDDGALASGVGSTAR
jgi:acyl transferase domain-containing protein